MDMIKTNPGLTVASTAPSRKRFAEIPAKLVHAGVVMRIIPQMMVAIERNLPILSR